MSKKIILILLLGGSNYTYASQGQNVYKQTCAVCHSVQMPGAPMLDSKADWKHRLIAGRQVLLRSVLYGYGAMPPKGGNASLSDAEAEAALDYMLSKIANLP